MGTSVIKIMSTLSVIISKSCLFVILSFTSLLFLNGCEDSSDSSDSALAKFKLEKKTKNGAFVVGNVAVGGTPNFVIDSSGNLFYPDTNNCLIHKVDVNGTSTVFAGSTYGNVDGTGTGAQFSRPYEITIDSQGNLYVADYGTWSLRKITPAAVVTTLFTFPAPEMPQRLVIDSNGDFFYTEMNSWGATNKIKKLSGGVISTFAGSGVAGFVNGTGVAASFNNPNFLVIDSQDNLYVSDVGNYVIRKITPAGVVTTFSGNGIQGVENGNSSNSQFYFSGGLGYLAIDNSDTLYVGDMKFDTGYIRTINSNGKTKTYCGGGSTVDINAEGKCKDIGIWVNSGLAVAPNGVVYFIAGDILYRISK